MLNTLSVKRFFADFKNGQFSCMILFHPSFHMYKQMQQYNYLITKYFLKTCGL